MTNGKHEAKETLKSYSPTTTGLFPMKIIIETPKYSFWKYNKTEKGYEKVFFSPLPTIFNYGFVEGTKSADGMEEGKTLMG